MQTGLTRRAALAALSGSMAACTTRLPRQRVSAYRAPAAPPFSHGVASGDPRADRVIIWTRITPCPSGEPVTVHWETSLRPDFAEIAASGMAPASPAQDWTVKADAAGLSPGQTYYFRFRFGAHVSPAGRTRTLPAGDAGSVRIAIVSCAHHGLGYFNAYDHIARQDDFDAVLHLGDYIYETAAGEFDGVPDELPGRQHDPPEEAANLAAYRARYNQYRRDASLQALHARHPVIAIWDDHEIADNAYASGAPDHHGDAGDWQRRKAAALQAWYEWMPVREPPEGRSRAQRFKAIRLGQVATLCLLESRLSARMQGFGFPDIAQSADNPEALAERIRAEDREKIGAAQRAAVADAALASGAGWMLLASATLMARVATPDVRPHLTPDGLAELNARWPDAAGFLTASRHGLPLTLDAWDGYPAARERLFGAMQSAGRQDILVLSGDTHAWWVNDLRRDSGEEMGIELGVASVTSPSALSPRLLGPRGRDFALLLTRDNPDVRYVSGESHGYLDLVLTPSAGQARLISVDTVTSPDYGVFQEAQFGLRRQEGRARVRAISGLGFRQRYLF